MSPNVGSVHQNQAAGGGRGSVSVNPQRHRRIFRNLRVPGPRSSAADWDSPRVSSGSPSSQWLPLFPMGEWLGSFIGRGRQTPERGSVLLRRALGQSADVSREVGNGVKKCFLGMGGTCFSVLGTVSLTWLLDTRVGRPGWQWERGGYG